MIKTFSRKQVMELTGFSARNVQYYVDKHIVFARIKMGPDPETRVVYFESSMAEFLIVKELTAMGIKGKSLKAIMDGYREVCRPLEKAKKAYPEFLCFVNNTNGRFNIQLIDNPKESMLKPGVISMCVVNHKRVQEIISKL